MKEKDNNNKMYEQMSLSELIDRRKQQTKRVTVYFIGLCVFFVICFFYGIQIHMYFVAFSTMLFVGFLLVFYMQTYVFIRIIGVIKYGDKYIDETKKAKDDI